MEVFGDERCRKGRGIHVVLSNVFSLITLAVDLVPKRSTAKCNLPLCWLSCMEDRHLGLNLHYATTPAFHTWTPWWIHRALPREKCGGTSWMVNPAQPLLTPALAALLQQHLCNSSSATARSCLLLHRLLVHFESFSCTTNLQNKNIILFFSRSSFHCPPAKWG